MTSSAPIPDVVVVGAASRDRTTDDPRGWRLGGGASYSALTTARLGLRTAALIGVDEPAATATELDLLRDAGVDLVTAPLEHGPVFENLERPGGRVQLVFEAADEIAPDAIPERWRASRGWLLTPIAGELPPGWALVPPEHALVAVGWQGLLRELIAGEPVRRTAPASHAILARADMAGISRDDVAGDVALAALYGSLRPGATLALTQGAQGGLVVDGTAPDDLRYRRYPAIEGSPVDPTGAGDVFLAALASARIQPRLVGGRIAQGMDVLLAAAAASLVAEAPGLLGVPDRDSVRRRMAEGLAARRVR